jgi:hypothetical protein
LQPKINKLNMRKKRKNEVRERVNKGMQKKKKKEGEQEKK